MTENEVLASARREGYDLVQRELIDERPMWSWTGTDLPEGWWPSRSLAIDHMRDVQHGFRRTPEKKHR